MLLIAIVWKVFLFFKALPISLLTEYNAEKSKCPESELGVPTQIMETSVFKTEDIESSEAEILPFWYSLYLSYDYISELE